MYRFFFVIFITTIKSLCGQCIEVDKYPISDHILRTSPRNLQIDSVIAYDQVWFRKNDESEVIIIELATDLHRFVTTHFLVDSIESHNLYDEVSNSSPISGNYFHSHELEDYYIKRFSDSAVYIEDSCFQSQQGHVIGEPITVAMEKYGEPDTIINNDEYLKLNWFFKGGLIHSNIMVNCAQDSFGYYLTFIYRNNLLVARVVINDIP
jgi:hypothetical protein